MPYIDVMLVLLVIFMVTAPMLMQGVEVDLPDADAAPVKEQDAEPLSSRSTTAVNCFSIWVPMKSKRLSWRRFGSGWPLY